jgi:hypothetical protein
VPIRRYVEEGAFDPELVKAMSAAFIEARKAIEVSNQSNIAHETIAAKIVELARSGETDPVVLREMALSELGVEPASQRSRD